MNKRKIYLLLTLVLAVGFGSYYFINEIKPVQNEIIQNTSWLVDEDGAMLVFENGSHWKWYRDAEKTKVYRGKYKLYKGEYALNKYVKKFFKDGKISDEERESTFGKNPPDNFIYIELEYKSYLDNNQEMIHKSQVVPYYGLVFENSNKDIESIRLFDATTNFEFLLKRE